MCQLKPGRLPVLIIAILLILLYETYHRYQTEPVDRILTVETGETEFLRQVEIPQDQTIRASDLPPLADKDNLTKTEPVDRILTVETGETEFLRQVEIPQDQTIRASDRPPLADKDNLTKTEPVNGTLTAETGKTEFLGQVEIPQDQTIRASDLPPLADKDNLTKTEPVNGTLTVETGKTEFLRQVEIPQDQTIRASDLPPLADKDNLTKPQDQTIRAFDLPPLADKDNLTKTEPVHGTLTVETGEMEFVRQVEISKTNGVIGGEKILNSWDFKHLSFFYHSYLDNVHLICELAMKVGSVFASGNYICDEDKFRPRKPCLAYIFRETGKDSLFEDHVVRLYGCEVFLFSPGPVDVLKMDLDGGEWDILSRMASARELSQIRQLVVSLTMPDAKAKQKEAIVQNLLVLKDLQDAGFRIFRTIMRYAAEKVEGVYPVVRTITYDVSMVNTEPPARITPKEVSPYAFEGEQDMNFLRQLRTPLWELPSWEEIQTLPAREVHYLYNRFLDNPTIRCNLMVKLGQVVDGGYRVCDDAPYRPPFPCLVYSFGIRNEFSFDDDAARLYGCEVFSFDPSMAKSYRRYDKVTFYKLGIGGHMGQLGQTNWRSLKDKKIDWRIESLTDIKHLLGHEKRTVDVLKMDPEGAEWSALEDMVRTGELARVRQLVVEFHLWDLASQRLNLWKNDSVHAIRRYLNILSELARTGFRISDSHMFAPNPGLPRLDNVYPVPRSICVEVSFVNTRFQLPSSVTGAP